jgi:hypothetical protein
MRLDPFHSSGVTRILLATMGVNVDTAASRNPALLGASERRTRSPGSSLAPILMVSEFETPPVELVSIAQVRTSRHSCDITSPGGGGAGLGNTSATPAPPLPDPRQA